MGFNQKKLKLGTLHQKKHELAEKAPRKDHDSKDSSKVPMGTKVQTSMMEKTVRKIIKISDIIDQRQLREELNPAHVSWLVGEIKRDGLESPIIVQPSGDKYIALGGLHRIAAFEVLGLDEIPAIIKTPENDYECDITAFKSNSGNLPFSDYELSKLIPKLVRDGKKQYSKFTYDDLAAKINMSKDVIKKFMSLEGLSSKALELLNPEGDKTRWAKSKVLLLKNLSVDDQDILIDVFGPTLGRDTMEIYIKIWKLLSDDQKQLIVNGSTRWDDLEQDVLMNIYHTFYKYEDFSQRIVGISDLSNVSGVVYCNSDDCWKESHSYKWTENYLEAQEEKLKEELKPVIDLLKIPEHVTGYYARHVPHPDPKHLEFFANHFYPIKELELQGKQSLELADFWNHFNKDEFLQKLNEKKNALTKKYPDLIKLKDDLDWFVVSSIRFNWSDVLLESYASLIVSDYAIENKLIDELKAEAKWRKLYEEFADYLQLQDNIKEFTPLLNELGLRFSMQAPKIIADRDETKRNIMSAIETKFNLFFPGSNPVYKAFHLQDKPLADVWSIIESEYLGYGHLSDLSSEDMDHMLHLLDGMNAIKAVPEKIVKKYVAVLKDPMLHKKTKNALLLGELDFETAIKNRDTNKCRDCGKMIAAEWFEPTEPFSCLDCKGKAAEKAAMDKEAARKAALNRNIALLAPLCKKVNEYYIADNKADIADIMEWSYDPIEMMVNFVQAFEGYFSIKISKHVYKDKPIEEYQKVWQVIKGKLTPVVLDRSIDEKTITGPVSKVLEEVKQNPESIKNMVETENQLLAKCEAVIQCPECASVFMCTENKGHYIPDEKERSLQNHIAYCKRCRKRFEVLAGEEVKTDKFDEKFNFEFTWNQARIIRQSLHSKIETLNAESDKDEIKQIREIIDFMEESS